MTWIILFSLLWSFGSTLSEYPFEGPGIYQIMEPIDHSESPTWDSRNNILYFVNIHEGEIYRYELETNVIRVIKLNGEVAPVIPSKNNPYLLVAGLNRSVVVVEWYGTSEPGEPRILTTVSNQFPTSRFNDGKADKNGRLWIGTMGYEGPEGLKSDEGVLYKVTCDNLESPAVEIAPVNISNGLAWNAANDKFFYIDTPTGQVVEYVYAGEKGEISNRRVVFDIKNHSDRLTGNPDGMTIDEDDNLWVALYGGGAVIKVNSSNGDLLQIVALPALDVTSAIWGGQDLDILFVTTSRYSLTEEQRKQQPAAGGVFAVVGLGTKGLPVFEVDITQSLDGENFRADISVHSGGHGISPTPVIPLT